MERATSAYRKTKNKWESSGEGQHGIAEIKNTDFWNITPCSLVDIHWPLILEAAYYTATSVNFYQNKRHQTPEESILLANNQLDAPFHVFIYFISLHFSSITVLIIRRSNCINTSSGVLSPCKWLLGMLVRRELRFPPDRHTKQSLTWTKHTRWCINKIRSPDDEHRDARKM